MRGSAVVVDLPLVPVMATTLALEPCGAPLAAEQLGVADDFDARRFRALDGPMRLRMRERHAGREDQRGESAPVGLVEIDGLETRLDAPPPGLSRHRPKRRLRAARLERLRRRKAGQAKPEHRDFLPWK